ncbi:MAG: hypothetical protein A3J28_16525 [Acidobacteria bacterium RIFCSPLOWO2_12_FULL_60_22]|nr:MAG: hypothetical protein A3J28_16525 [Acidobacteria bacterium RIFCSPLOWO2_12_FULL_60_22]
MEELRFGIEVEVIADRPIVAQSIGEVVGADVEKIDDETYRVGTWKVERDESIQVPENLQAEVVSPILQMADMELVKRIADTLKGCGARVDESCGIHVHVGIPREDYHCVRILARVMKFIEPLFYTHFQVASKRIPYAEPVSQEFLEKLEELTSVGTQEDFVRNLAGIWYPDANVERAKDRWDQTRYRGLNLHSLLYRGTVEFRYYNSTLEGKLIESYVRASMSIIELARALAKPEEKGVKEIESKAGDQHIQKEMSEKHRETILSKKHR